MNGLLKNRNFLLLISGKTISLMGTAVFDIALMWHFLSEYGSASGALLAWVMILGTLPAALLGSVIGMLADRVNKKYIMAISDTISGLAVTTIVIAMYFTHLTSPWLLAAVGLLAVTASCISISVYSMIPELFENKALYQANAINQFSERGTMLAGFALGGGLVALAGVKTVFLINAVSYFVSAACTLFIRYKPLIIERGAATGFHFLADIREVTGFLKTHKNLLILTLMFTGVNFFWDPLGNIILPYVAKNDLLAGALEFGLIQAALPTGFCIGALVFTKTPSLIQKRNVIFYSILGANIVFSIFAAFALLGQDARTAAIYVTMGMLACGGVFSAALNITAAVTIQANVPDNLRGKYYGFVRSLSSGLVPLGSMGMGLLLGTVDKVWLLAMPLAAVFILLFTVPRGRYAINVAQETVPPKLENVPDADTSLQA
jgi:MFS transporter, DHA3 family, macrolide efflux protein